MLNSSFDEVFSFKNLYLAHLKGRIGKRKRHSVVKFETATLEKLFGTYSLLSSGKFRLGDYSSFTVEVPKHREIQTLPYGERIVQHALCDNFIAPYFSKRAVIDNCVCQVGKGSHFALRRFESKLKKFLHTNGSGYILKCDIKKYFPSLSHEVLKQIFLNEIADIRLRQVVSDIIDSYHTSPQYLKDNGIERLEFDGEKTGRGVPIGNQTSQIFGMFYLNRLDRIIKEEYRVKIYSRYMDDFIIVHQSKEFLKELLKKITKVLSEMKLSLNSRTQIFPTKNGLTYLGFRYQVSRSGKLIKKVTRKTAKRLKARTKLMCVLADEKFVDSKRLKQSLSAYHGHLKHGNCKKLEDSLSTCIRQKINKLAKEEELCKRDLQGKVVRRRSAAIFARRTRSGRRAKKVKSNIFKGVN